MTPGTKTVAPAVTLEDLKHKAGRIRDLALAEVRHQTEDRVVRNAAMLAGVVLLAVGLAYFIGTRRACEPPVPPEGPSRH